MNFFLKKASKVFHVHNKGYTKNLKNNMIAGKLINNNNNN